jgi:hypothetical protein
VIYIKMLPFANHSQADRIAAFLLFLAAPGRVSSFIPLAAITLAATAAVKGGVPASFSIPPQICN